MAAAAATKLISEAVVEEVMRAFKMLHSYHAAVSLCTAFAPWVAVLCLRSESAGLQFEPKKEKHALKVQQNS